MHDLSDFVRLCTLLSGLATGLVKLFRELRRGRAERRKRKGRHFRSDGLTS